MRVVFVLYNTKGSVITMRVQGENNALNDILYNTRFQGALESLTWVTNIVDVFFQGFISIIGFFIISSALLKNVFAAAYVSNPKFWDKVNDTQEWLDGNLRGKGNIKGVKVGSFAAWILSWVPNVKEMTDFYDDTVEPKDYFIKAIPQMVCIVMIGAIIYNGYYRDLVGRTTELGSELICRFLTNVDPVAVFDKVTNSVGTPPMVTDKDDSMRGKLINKIAGKMYSMTVSFYTDVNSLTQKTAVSEFAEAQATEWIDQCSDYLDDEQWKVQYQIDRVIGNVDVTSANTADSETVSKCWTVSIKEFGLDTKMHKDASTGELEDWYYRVRVIFTRVHKGTQSVGQLNNVAMTVPNSKWATSGGETVIKDIMEGNYMQIVSANAKIDGKYSFAKSGNNIIVNGEIAPGKHTVTGLYYSINGKRHTITDINVSSTASTFKMSDASGSVANDWSIGEVPQYSEDNGTATNTSNDNSKDE